LVEQGLQNVQQIQVERRNIHRVDIAPADNQLARNRSEP
jgi:hypothetical protein